MLLLIFARKISCQGAREIAFPEHVVILDYPVVIINWVQYLGPPVPFSFPDSRDLLEVLGDFLGRERGGGP